MLTYACNDDSRTLSLSFTHHELSHNRRIRIIEMAYRLICKYKIK